MCRKLRAEAVTRVREGRLARALMWQGAQKPPGIWWRCSTRSCSQATRAGRRLQRGGSWGP